MAAAAAKPLERGETDPLLAALIARLPPAGADWPIAKREAWLKLVWQTFDLVYEGGGEVAELPSFIKPAAAPVVVAAAAPAKPALAAPLGPVEYIIDINGFLKRLPDGARITFNDIPKDEVLWDERPERNRHDDIHTADGDWPFGALPALSIATR